MFVLAFGYYHLLASTPQRGINIILGTYHANSSALAFSSQGVWRQPNAFGQAAATRLFSK